MIAVIVGAPRTGKTTILKQLQLKGFRIFHADSFIAQEYKNGGRGYELIKNNFGEEYVNNDSVNKDKIKEAIFNDSEFLIRLNELIHPLIKDHLEGKDDFVAELPIISSTPIKFDYDKTILVKADAETIKKRLGNEDDKEFLDYIISRWDNKIDFDYVVDTTTETKLEEFEKQLLEWGITNGH